MAFNIENFGSQISSRGTIKTSKFEVNFQLPPVWDGDPNKSEYDALIRDIGLRGDRTAIPAIMHRTTKVRRYGYGTDEDHPIAANFEDAQISFISDADGDFWQMFWKWMNKVHNVDTSKGIWKETGETAGGSTTCPFEFAYKSEYVTQILLTWYSEEGRIAKNILLNDAFPTGISEIKLDWGDGQNIARFIVNFSYQDFNIDENPDQPITGGFDPEPTEIIST